MLQKIQARKHEVDEVTAHYCNLRTADKEHEAVNYGRSYLSDLAKIIAACEESELGWLAETFRQIAIAINEERFGKTTIDIVIQHLDLAAKSKIGIFSKDLTGLYMLSGFLASRVPEWQEESYRCYWMAAETLPPKGCKMPASYRAKANAHSAAWHMCNELVRLNTSNQAEWAKRKSWHDAKRKEYAPGHNWEAPSGI